MQDIYMICGVSGSGKSWVCRQLTDKFHYIPHDETYDDSVRTLYAAAKTAAKPIITECPFGERILRANLQNLGMRVIPSFRVIPYFIVEHPVVVASRYFERENKELPKAAATRASSILHRAMEWQAPYGTSAQVLSMLKELKLK